MFFLRRLFNKLIFPKERASTEVWHVWPLSEFSSLLDAAPESCVTDSPFAVHQRHGSCEMRLCLRPNVTVDGGRVMRLGLELMRGPQDKVRVKRFEVGILRSNGSDVYANDLAENYDLRADGNYWCPSNRGRALCPFDLDKLRTDSVIDAHDRVLLYCHVEFPCDYFSRWDKFQSNVAGNTLFRSGPCARRSKAKARGSDVVLASNDGKEFAAHWSVLRAQSVVFDRMFESEGFLERKSNRIKFGDLDGKALKQLLRALYVGCDKKSAVEMLYSADKYDLCALKHFAEESLLADLSCKSAAVSLYISDIFSLPLLKAAALSFIASNREEVGSTRGWKMIESKEHLLLAIDNTQVALLPNPFCYN